MHNSFNLRLVFRLDRQTVAVVPDCDDIVLQAGSIGDIHHAVQLGMDLFVRL